MDRQDRSKYEEFMEIKARWEELERGVKRDNRVFFISNLCMTILSHAGFIAWIFFVSRGDTNPWLNLIASIGIGIGSATTLIYTVWRRKEGRELLERVKRDRKESMKIWEEILSYAN